MLVSDKDAIARLNSSSNLINRLRRASGEHSNSNGAKRTQAMSLFVPSGQSSPKKESANPPQKPLAVDSGWNPFAETNETAGVEIELRSRLNALSAAQPPEQITITADDILTNADGRIKIVQAHDDALNVVAKALTALSTKIDDVKPEKLPAIIQAAMKTVESIRKEKMELLKESQGREVHFHFYEPARRKITDYEVIDVG